VRLIVCCPVLLRRASFVIASLVCCLIYFFFAIFQIRKARASESFFLMWNLADGFYTNSSTPLPVADPHVYNLTHYVLAGAYFVLTLFTLGLVVYKCASNTLRETWKVLFFAFVILGAAMRGCWAVFDPLMLNQTMLITNRTDLFLNLFPSALFFSCYLVLLFLWIEVYHYPRASGLRIHHLRLHLWVVTISMMAIFLILFVVDATVFPSEFVTVSSPANIVERVLILYVATLYVLCCAVRRGKQKKQQRYLTVLKYRRSLFMVCLCWFLCVAKQSVDVILC
jgi:hypothetical protein